MFEPDIYVIRTRSEDYFAIGKGPQAGALFRMSSHYVTMPNRDAWRVESLVQPHGWGVKTRLPFKQWSTLDLDAHTCWRAGDDWHYKNGKAKFRLCDVDHGTTRRWGEPIVKLSGWTFDMVIRRAEDGIIQKPRFATQPGPDSYRQLSQLMTYVAAAS